jgi:hypothetical protein
MDTNLDTISELLRTKAFVKLQAFRNTEKAFLLLQEVLRETEQDLKKRMASWDFPVEVRYRKMGDFQAEFTLAEDTLVFLMHTNAFTFHGEHSIWRTSYAKKDEHNSFCGMISVYNFLSDSFRYKRNNDIGYMIARMFVNSDNHYFVEGKRRLGFLYNDFNNCVISREDLRSFAEALIKFSQDFDMYVPPFHELSQATVEEIQATAEYSVLSTGKRLGFRFQDEESALNRDNGKK